MLWLGLGCQSHPPGDFIAESIQELFLENSLPIDNLAGIATLETKAEEYGIITVCKKYHLRLKLFSAQLLSQVPVLNPSVLVAEKVQTKSVAEAAAILAALESSLEELGTQIPAPLNFINQGESNSKLNLVVPKTVFTQKNLDTKTCVTLAVARA